MDAQLNPPPPTKDQRRASFRTASWADRLAMHEAIGAHKSEAIEARRALARSYLERHPAGCALTWERAVAFEDMAGLTLAAREEAVRLAQGRAAQADNGALEFPVLAQDFAADSATIELAMAPPILTPIVRYFGMLPVLFNLFVTRAHTTEFLENTAHMFHLDPEDVVSLKVFIHLTEVDEDCGPFHCLPAHLSAPVLEQVDYRGIGRISDEDIDRMAGWDNVVRLIGPPGAVGFADTTRCLHFGGRPRKAGKPVRDMLVFQYLLPTSLLFPIDGDARQPRFFPQLEPRGEPEWDALIGAIHN